MNNSEVYRFCERVALALRGKSETIYLTPREARRIARALNAGARDCLKNPGAQGFIKSQFQTAVIEGEK